MKNRIKIALLLFCVSSQGAYAVEFVRITDASLLKYSTYADGKVYLRNLNVFDASALGCCWNYYVDTTTVEGKLIWTIILSSAAQGKGMNIGVPTGYAAGAVSYGGDF